MMANKVIRRQSDG